MTRKSLLFFILVFTCMWFLLSGLLGEEGFIYNRQLEEELERQEESLLKLKTAQANFKRQEVNILTENFLKDGAIKQGYSLDGDEVYYFKPDSLDYKTEKMYDLKRIQANHQKAWHLSKGSIALISLAISTAATFFLGLIRKSGSRKNDGGAQDGT